MKNRKTDKQFKINNEIRSSQVRVIFEDESTSVMPIEDALSLANEKQLDLIEISTNVSPAICKMMEYSKYIYQLNKRNKTHKTPKLKEVKFTSTIDNNDISYRIKSIKEFLSNGHRVKVTMVYKGRTITHAEIGEDKLTNILEQVKDYGIPQSKPVFEGKYLSVYLNPTKK